MEADIAEGQKEMGGSMRGLLVVLTICIAFTGLGQGVKLGVPLGHPEFSITKIESSNDDRFLIVGSRTGSVKLFDIETGKLLKSFKDHLSPIRGIFFTESGNYFVSYCEEGKVIIYSVTSLDKVLTIEGYHGVEAKESFKIESIDFNVEENQCIISGGDYNPMSYLVKIGNGKVENSSIEKFSGVKLGKFHPSNNEYLIFVDEYNSESSVHFYNLKIKEWEETHILKLESESLREYQIDVLNDRVMAYSYYSICVQGAAENVTKKFDKLIHKAGFLNDSILCVIQKDEVILLSSTTLLPIKRISNVNSDRLYGTPYSGFLKNNSSVIVSNSKGLIEVSSAGRRNIHENLKDWGKKSRGIITTKSGEMFMVLKFDGMIDIYESKSGKVISSFDLTSIPIEGLNAINNKILINYENGSDIIFDFFQGKTVAENKNYRFIYNHDFTSRIELNDSSRVSLLYSLELNKIVAELDTNVISASFSPTDNSIITGLENEIMSLYNSEGSVVDTVHLGFRPHLLQFSPDGNRILAASYSGNLAIYDISQINKLIYKFDYYSIRGILWSPDSRKLAINGERVYADDRSYAIIDLVTFEKKDSVLVTTKEKEIVRSWVFTPNSNEVLIADSKGDNRYLGSGLNNYYGNILFDFEPIRKNAIFIDDQNYLLGQDKFINWYEVSQDTIQDKKRRRYKTKGNGELIGLSNHRVETNHTLKRSFNIHSENVIGLDQTETMLVSLGEDGAILFWEKSTITPIIQLYFINADPAKWVHIHSSGLFDASPEAMDLMYWTKGLEVIEFSQLKDRYWVPGLWKKVMNGEKLPDVRGMQELKLQPKVNFGELKNDQLPINLSKRDGGYGKVSIFINGKEVINDARGNDLDTSEVEQTILYSIKDHPYLVNGENEIMVKASSADGFVQGRGELFNTYVEKKTSKPQFFGVVIGVSEYMNSKIDLKYPVNDAKAISNSLQMGAENLFGEEKTFIYSITSEEGNKPTKENIQLVFETIGKKAKPEDVIVIYLSGHGVTWGGDEGDFYFLTSDATAAYKDAYNDPVIRQNNTISTAEWVEMLKSVAALKQVMIIDACGSGKAVDNLIASRDVETSQIKAIDRMKDRTGMYIISGCTADAVSYEASQYGQGLLTYSILEAMKGAAIKPDGSVDVDLMMQHARERVPVLADGVGGIQQPQLLAPKGGSFDIGILDEADKKLIPLASPKRVFVRSTLVDSEEFEDVLGLSDLLDEELISISSKGAESNIVYFDAKKYPNACKISGGYSVEGMVIKLSLKIRCGEELENMELEANTKEELVKEIIKLVE